MKPIKIFKRGTQQLQSGVDTWIVKWTARYGKFFTDTTPMYQAFTNKQEAEDFAESIRRAHKLIGNCYADEIAVHVYKQKQFGLEE